MANNLSDYAENKLLDHITNGSAYAQPTVRVALFTADPTEAGSLANEVPATGGTGYARQTLVASAASAGANSNSAEIVFPVNGSGTPYTVTHVGLIDSPTLGSGNVIASGPCTNKTIDPGDQYRFPVGDLDLALT